MDTYKRGKRKKKEFRVATFNVRGLNETVKKENLHYDILQYGVDICCLQETKLKKGSFEQIKGYELCCFPTKQDAYGMGFMISKKWCPNIHKKWKVNDRIAIIQLNPEIKRRKK